MRPVRWTIAVVGTVVLLVSSVSVAAQERDSDGTRMQARQVEIGTVHSDRLAHPDEEADWRMIRLEDDHSIELALTVETDDRTATLTLTEATGEQLVRRATDESAEIATKLQPGIYYVAVESSESLEYELAID